MTFHLRTVRTRCGLSAVRWVDHISWDRTFSVPGYLGVRQSHSSVPLTFRSQTATTSLSFRCRSSPPPSRTIRRPGLGASSRCTLCSSSSHRHLSLPSHQGGTAVRCAERRVLYTCVYIMILQQMLCILWAYKTCACCHFSQSTVTMSWEVYCQPVLG